MLITLSLFNVYLIIILVLRKMDSYIKYKVADLIKMNNEFVSQANSLTRQLEKINSVKEELGRIINKYHKEHDLQVDIFLPSNLFEDLIAKRKSMKLSINWKTLVLETLTEFDSIFSTERIFLLNRVKYPNEFLEKEKAIRNISSALRNLYLEGRIEKFTDKKGKINYGLKDRHFESDGKPKKEFLKN